MSQEKRIARSNALIKLMVKSQYLKRVRRDVSPYSFLVCVRGKTPLHHFSQNIDGNVPKYESQASIILELGVNCEVVSARWQPRGNSTWIMDPTYACLNQV